MSPCPIWKCDLKTTPCYKDNAIDQKCTDNPPIPDHNQRMTQREKNAFMHEMTHSMMARRVLGCGRATLKLRAWEALRAKGACVLLAQLRILAKSLTAIKEEEKMNEEKI